MNRLASGLRAWAWQRLSALYMALFLPAAAALAWTTAPTGYDRWLALLRQPAVSVSVGLFFALLLIHAWVGIRDLLLDYLHAPAARFTALALCAVGLMGLGLWTLLILTRVWT